MKAVPIALAAALFAAPALAGTPVQVAHFDKISLGGGGHVVVRHGAQQSVSLLKGSTLYTTFRVRDGELQISACEHDCPSRYDLEIEIVTPELQAASIEGGGHVEAEAGFPAQRGFAAAVEGGGHLDMTALTPDKVDASVEGGGHVEIKAVRSLTAAVDGGGSIVYRGDPEVTQAVEGGGSISHAR